MPLKRKTPLRPGKPLKRGTKAMRRSGKVKPINRERKAAAFERNFGEEAERVRAMPCLCWVRTLGHGRGGTPGCSGPHVEAAHVTARGQGGAKGGRMDIVPLCRCHHDKASEARTSARADFERRYDLDLRAEADRIALEHPRPLGIRGLADRWALMADHADAASDAEGRPLCPRCSGCGSSSSCGCGCESTDVDGGDAPMCQGCGARLPDKCDACDGWGYVQGAEPLDAYETDALLGWVRRAMERERSRRASRRIASERACGPMAHEREPDGDRDALTRHIAQQIGGPFVDQDLARALCEAAAARWAGLPEPFRLPAGLQPRGGIRAL